MADCARPLPFAVPMIAASGSKVRLRLAQLQDRERAYAWFAHSDLTPSFVGPPLYSEHSPPSFEAFCETYQPFYFDGTRPFDGRALMIEAGGTDVGFLSHGPVCLRHEVVELDLWLAARALCGKGYGSEALALACDWMQSAYGIDRFVVRPSRRNVRALRALRRAGFRETDLPAAQVVRELQLPAGRYTDEVLLFRTLASPPALLDPEPGRVYVFVDSEFTSLAEPRLISIGAVATDGAAFYCELSDWPRDAASAFARDKVLPRLDGEAVPHPVAAESFVRWLGERAAQGPVTLVSDSGFDRWALADLLGSEDLPHRCDWMRVPLAVEELDAVAAALRLRRHHALDDARALLRALLPE
ncbi:MAG TPA: GNAT family N-acetyltransferase [Burkholderiaceae bacterium]|nr:GNAT family N-acetyltransferase [Burkholderiaceae bacterium]